MRISTWYRWMPEKSSAYRLDLEHPGVSSGRETPPVALSGAELSEIVRRPLVVALDGCAEQLQILRPQLCYLAEE
jgi:hypothetical protein